MARLLAALTRDIARVNGVTEVDEARTIAEAVLHLAVADITESGEVGAPNDFFVTVPDDVLSRPEFVAYGIVDAATLGVGRLTATVIEEE